MEIILIIVTALVGLIAAIFDLKSSKFVVEQSGDELVEYESKGLTFWGYSVIILSIAAVTLSVIVKIQGDDLRAKKENETNEKTREMLRSDHPIEPIGVKYKVTVKLEALPNYASFVALANCIDKNRLDDEDSVYIDSNDPILKECLKPGDYGTIFTPLVFLSFCEKMEDYSSNDKSLYFLSNFDEEIIGSDTQDVKLEITYNRRLREFKIFYIANYKFNWRKGFTKKITSTLDLPGTFVVCNGFHTEDGCELKEIIIETGQTQLRTRFNKLSFDKTSNLYFQKISSEDLIYALPKVSTSQEQ